MKMSVADYLSQLTSDQVVTEEVEKTAGYGTPWSI